MDETRAREIAEQEFGLTIAKFTELGGNEDVNFLAVTHEGAKYVIKASATSRSALEAQTAVLGFLTEAVATFDVPSPRLTDDGESVVTVEGAHPNVRVLSFVPGEMSVGSRRVQPGVGAALGSVSGEMVAKLASFSHPGLVEGGDWDLREAPRVVGEDGPLGALLTASIERTARLSLPIQVIHGDLTEDNVVLGADADFAGVIDFGDLAPSWAVAELAVTLTSLLAHDGPVMEEVLDAVAAFHARRPLARDEARAVWPLVVRRALVLEAGAARVLAGDPTNEYALARRPFERLVLSRALSLPYDEAELLILDAVGMLPRREAPLVRMISGLSDAPTCDQSVTSEVHDGGAWREPASEHRHRECVTPNAVPTLLPEAATAAIPRSVPLGITAYVEPGREVYAPAQALVRSAEGTHMVLALVEGGWVHVDGVSASVEAGQTVAAGTVIGATVGPVWVQLCEAPITPPRYVQPGLEAHWARICPDPSVLFGRKPAPPSGPTAGQLVAARDAVVAPVQEHYYANPPRIERGWRHHLIDVNGRGYLDMVNNVAILGHGEPRLADAVERQMRLLNTNSRFNYEAIVEFSEALVRRCPPGLDQVLLVNSGSEAVDLAIRVIRAATGRSDLLALTEAYHGWTVGADAISTSLGDNPHALETRPDWVHLLDAPNTYRGRYRGDDVGRYAADAVARIDALDVPLAGLVCEPIFGNGGGILLPDGYLHDVYAAVRARGGLCVSDEVQVGYGRLGEYFWGFEQQGVVPDVIAVAKAMGNGHPLGAVVTTREIASRFAVEGSFFSSAGGSPVSCVVGSTVLRVLEEDGLQERARVVGKELADGLLALSARHPRLGAVHGMGLYLGVEVVDRGPDAPDPEGAREICEALLDEGVIVQPTGDHKNVLKIKPPLTLDSEGVSRFLHALDHVLTMADARSRL
ncbi:aminotransferase [Demequina sp.]|uniref:aminotransferase n=1 Tax=Demequina sp. TaxID=2050685 RepID=UPI003D13B874